METHLNNPQMKPHSPNGPANGELNSTGQSLRISTSQTKEEFETIGEI